MLKNYVLITVRNLLRNKTYSFINIFGLAVGLTCSILILLWVQEETSYDTFHPKANRLYQMWMKASVDGAISTWSAVPVPALEAVKAASSHVQNATVADWGDSHLLSVGEQPITQQGRYVGETFLEMFEFPLRQGDPATALDEPYSIVITQSTAQALFGDEDPLGQVVRVDDAHDVKVTGVLADIPSNSSFQFDFLLPWSLNEQHNEVLAVIKESWGDYMYPLYVELSDPSYLDEVNNSIRAMAAEHGADRMREEFFLYPLSRWHLHGNFKDGVEAGGMVEYVRLFSIIAIFILLIACINFMNLSTARSERRAQEVGIRKSVGSRRSELIIQFMGESLFITLLAFLLALLLTELALPFYNELVDEELSIDYTAWQFWLASVAIILCTGVVAGSYPALYLSSFQPIKVLKGKVKVGRGASIPRKVLVVLQFSFSILLIIGTIVIYQQIQLVQKRELGYNQENLVTVRTTDAIDKHYEMLKHELLQSGWVTSVTRSGGSIVNPSGSSILGWPGKPEDQQFLFTSITADYDYTETMGIKIVEGRSFSPQYASDTAAILVNKAAVDVMQLQEPIGAQLDLWGGQYTIIGIIDDVLIGSLFSPVSPGFIVLDDRRWSVTLRLAATDNLPETLAQVGGIFKEYNPAYPFEYEFVDEQFQGKYKTITLTEQLANLFTVLALLITGLGLLGLASYTAEQRTKEIGIRKVLGASVTSIVGLLSRDFSWLVFIALVLTTPLAWWALNTYLERYEIRTELHWWIFPLTGLLTLLFALTFIITQAVRAARSNPTEALRSE